jgi:hypothetical protein
MSENPKRDESQDAERHEEDIKHHPHSHESEEEEE